MKVTDLRRKLLSALAAGGSLAPGAVHAANLNTNLLANPGFETVDFGTVGAYGAPLILNWSSVPPGGFAYSHDGSGGVPDYANGGPLAGGGSYYFSANAGPMDAVVDAPGEFYQDIDVSTGPSGTLIASGNAAYKISAFFSGYLDQADFGSVHLDFRNASSTTIGTAVVSDSDNDTWGQDFRGGLIPVGTATVRVSAFGTAFSGGPDGYIDNVDFQVTNEVIQPALDITIDRANGNVTLRNRTGTGKNISGYQITSAFEGLVPASWLSIAENYDAGNPGPNQVDAAHNWNELTEVNAHGDLSEGDLQSGDGATLAHTRAVNLGNAWIRNPNEDLVFQYVSGGQVVQGVVSYIGNGNVPFAQGDLNVNGSITSADWVILRTNQHTNLSGLSLAEAYRLGDLTGDRQNNHADFVAFKAVYDAANGAGSFVAMLAAIPEPSTAILVLSAGLMAIPARRRPKHG